jgi:hypothetical protein
MSLYALDRIETNARELRAAELRRLGRSAGIKWSTLLALILPWPEPEANPRPVSRATPSG